MAKALKCVRRSVEKWIEQDEKFKIAYEDVREGLLDFAESQSYTLMKGIPVIEDGKLIDWRVRPSETMLIFFLKTKGKSRGYIERSEVTGQDGAPLNPKDEIDYSKLSDTVLDALIAAKKNDSST